VSRFDNAAICRITSAYVFTQPFDGGDESMSVTRLDVTPRNASLGPCATVQWKVFWDDHPPLIVNPSDP
jgi:hypothetical protein